MSNDKALADFVRANGTDLQILGLFFCRLLRADFYALCADPSPVLAATMTLSQQGKLGTAKVVEQLIVELEATGEDFLTDDLQGSILRL